jgi:hypothetical protein
MKLWKISQIPPNINLDEISLKIKELMQEWITAMQKDLSVNSYYWGKLEDFIEENLGSMVDKDTVSTNLMQALTDVNEHNEEGDQVPLSEEEIKEILVSMIESVDSLTELKAQAYQICIQNKHEMEPWTNTIGQHGGSIAKAESKCTDCNRKVEVMLNRLFPHLNSISGPAAKEKCIPQVNMEGITKEIGAKTKIWKIASSIPVVPNIPEGIGVIPIPSNHIRLYHYTRGNPEDIRQQGLKLSYARGETYGEPNMVWASSQPPDPSIKNIVEFHVPIDDQMTLEKPSIGQTPEEWMKGNHHVGFYRDIRPDEILAVHEPWHEKYRHIAKDPSLIKKVLAGELDDLEEDFYPDEFRAIQAIKMKMEKPHENLENS